MTTSRMARATAVILYGDIDRKSTRLNSSHSQISYAVFCLKKKTQRDAELSGEARQSARGLFLPLREEREHGRLGPGAQQRDRQRRDEASGRERGNDPALDQ